MFDILKSKIAEGWSESTSSFLNYLVVLGPPSKLSITAVRFFSFIVLTKRPFVI